MDTQTGQTREMADQVAERITTLSESRLWVVSPCDAPPEMAQLGALDELYELIGIGHLEAIDQGSSMDPATEDLLLSPVFDSRWTTG